MLLFSGFLTLVIFMSFYSHPPVYFILLELLFAFISPPLISGFFYATLQAVRTDTATMQANNFFYTFTPVVWISLILLRCIGSVLVGLGMLCFIIPGIYLAICFMFSELLYLEYHKHGLHIGNCLSISRTIIHKNWCAWFGFAIVCGLVSCIPFCFPVSMIALVIAFKDTVGLIEAHDPNSFTLSTTL